MNIKLFVAAIFGYLGGSMVAHVIEGTWYGSSEASLIACLSVIKIHYVLGIPIPLINWDFFTIGLPAITSFNYSFLSGNSTYLFLIALHALISFGVLICLIIAFFNIVASFKRLL